MLATKGSENSESGGGNSLPAVRLLLAGKKRRAPILRHHRHPHPAMSTFQSVAGKRYHIQVSRVQLDAAQGYVSPFRHEQHRLPSGQEPHRPPAVEPSGTACELLRWTLDLIPPNPQFLLVYHAPSELFRGQEMQLRYCARERGVPYDAIL